MSYHQLVARLMSEQSSNFFATIPYGDIHHLQSQDTTLKVGDTLEDNLILEEFIPSSLKMIDAKSTKVSYKATKPFKTNRLIVYIDNNDTTKIRFCYKSNCVSICNEATLSAYFPCQLLDNVLMQVKLSGLFKDIFKFYIVRFPFYIYFNLGDILELHHGCVQINTLPVFAASCISLEPIFLAGSNKCAEVPIVKTLPEHSSMTAIFKNNVTENYNLGFNNRSIFYWSTAKEDILCSSYAIYARTPGQDGISLKNDFSQPTYDEFVQVLSLLNNINRSFSFQSHLVELLKLLHADSILIDFLQVASIIKKNNECDIYYDNLLTKELFAACKIIFHILNALGVIPFFYFKDKSICFHE